MQGLRPPVPEDAPEALAKLLDECWDENPDNRPDMDTIMETLYLVEEQEQLNSKFSYNVDEVHVCFWLTMRHSWC